jgi:hypothetical protein
MIEIAAFLVVSVLLIAAGFAAGPLVERIAGPTHH